MIVIAHRAIREYSIKQPQAALALEDWYRKTEKADWKTIADVRATFGYADNVGGERFVFNIRGNHYRLVAAIHFRKRTVYVKFIGTHREYESIDVSTIEQF